MLPAASSEDDLSESGWSPADLGLVEEGSTRSEHPTSRRTEVSSGVSVSSGLGSVQGSITSRSTGSVGRRALSHSIRHHAAILQHKAVDKIDVDDPTEQKEASRVMPQPNLNQISDPLDEDEAVIGSDWNFFTPPTIPAEWSQQIIRNVPKLSRKWVILLTVFAFLLSISFAMIFGINKAGYKVADPSTVGLKETVGATIQSVGATISGISQTTLQLQTANIRLPEYIQTNLGDVGSGLIPFYVFIPETGGLTLQRLTRECLGLVEASNAGSQDLAGTSLTVQTLPGGGRYVNVDMNTDLGLDRAKNFQIASSGLVDIVYSPLFYPVVEKIFDSNRTGRMFTIFCHPVSRAIMVYQKNQAPGTTMEQYILSGQLENNYVTRVLVNKLQGQNLVKEDLDLALDTLRRKCVIGLSESLLESLERFRKSFGWPEYDTARVGCAEAADAQNTNQTIAVEGESLWNEILKQNDFDLQVFEYAKVLYNEQRQ